MRGKKKPNFRAQRVRRENRLNREITEPKVRVILDDGAEVMDTADAIRKAEELGVDLVEIAKAPDMPITRIIDYGKFKFEKTKKDKENKKKQRVIQVKEIKMGPKIDVGDFERKTELAREFLEEGDNVKVSMRFRGREMAHTEVGLEKLQAMLEKLEGTAALEKHPSLEGRMMTMILRPGGKKSGGKGAKEHHEEEGKDPKPSAGEK